MSLTKAQLRTKVLEAMDATGFAWRWDTSAGGEVDFWIGQGHDFAWRALLNANPYYRVGRRTPTSDSQGRYAISDLTSGSGNSQERFFKVIAVCIDNVVYKEVQMKDFIQTAVNGILEPWYYWWFEGDYIKALPTQANKTATVIAVNHIPTRFDQIADDTDTVIWPDGYEQVLIWAATISLLNKGGTESAAAAPLNVLLLQAQLAMNDDIARRSTAPTQMRYNDSSNDWGAQ